MFTTLYIFLKICEIFCKKCLPQFSGRTFEFYWKFKKFTASSIQEETPKLKHIFFKQIGTKLFKIIRLKSANDLLAKNGFHSSGISRTDIYFQKCFFISIETSAILLWIPKRILPHLNPGKFLTAESTVFWWRSSRF